MAYHSRKKWIEFSGQVQLLRRRLVMWLEGLLAKPITSYEGSDSVIFEPNNWSKYKLVPYDLQSMPPLAGLNEGVLICLDKGTCLRFCRGMALEEWFPNIPWHPEALTYKVGLERTYRVVPIPVTTADNRKTQILLELTSGIRQIEQES